MPDEVFKITKVEVHALLQKFGVALIRRSSGKRRHFPPMRADAWEQVFRMAG
jgi:hypothetical protein